MEAATSPMPDARILIVDEDPDEAQLLKSTLERAGYNHVRSSRRVRPLLSFRTFDPDVVVLDLELSREHQLELGRAISRSRNVLGAPQLLIAAPPTDRHEALELGASDFLTKPLDPLEIVLRVRSVLERRSLYARLLHQNRLLEERVRERTAELEEAQYEVLERLGIAAEFRDDASRQHTQRVGRMSALLGRELGMSGSETALLRWAAPLHDIGKLGIPDAILLKQSDLTPQEETIMRTHCRMGFEILSGSRFELLERGAEIALTHHERWDGSGYPAGLSGEAIPLNSRIVAVADVFDALVHERPYKPAWTLRNAASEITGQSGGQFDPRVVQAFRSVIARDW